MHGAGRYEILRPIGSGGMAELFLARRRGDDPQRLVVVKRILPHLARDAGFVKMFLNEASIAATLAHPNVVAVLDFGHEDGDYFLTMEYVHGADLGALLESAAAVDDLPLDVALTIVHGACAGLHHAHEKVGADGSALHLVHRDVSPHNVMIGYDGAVKMTDFGIATATAHTRTTRAGTLKGKISYMAPEQVKGARIDRRADVFALGILLYETTLLTRLFVADNDYALMNQVIEAKVTPPRAIDPGYSPALQAIVMRALAAAPEQRLESAAALQDAIERFAVEHAVPLSAGAVAQWVQRRLGAQPWPGLDDEPRSPSPIATVPTRVGPRTHAPLVIAGLAAIGLLAAGGAWALADRSDATTPPPAIEPPAEPQVVVIPSAVAVPTADDDDDAPVLIDAPHETVPARSDRVAPVPRRPAKRKGSRSETSVAAPRYDLDEVAPPK